MKKIVSPRLIRKAKSVLGKYAFGTLSLDRLELLLKEPTRLFKNKLSVFRLSGNKNAIKSLTYNSWKVKNQKLKDKEKDLYDR